MRFLVSLLTVGLLAAGHVRGQSFERGYLVTTAGDTLRGELENRFWQGPPEGVVFRPTANVPGVMYPRTRLRAFRLESGRYFRAEVVPLDRDARTQVSDLPRRLVINQRPDSLLAEVLVDGPVPLLRAVVDGVTHYFVRRPGKPFLELTERKYLADVGGRQLIRDANNYKSQLATYFGDCPVAVTAADAAPFSAKGLTAVVQAFSTQCTEGRQPGLEVLASAPAHRPFAYNWGVLAAGSYNHEQFGSTPNTGEEAPLLSNLNLDGKVHPVGGLYLDVLLPGRRWAGHGEAAFSTYGRRGTFPLAGGAGSYTWHGTKLDFRLGPRYFFKQLPTREWFAGGGFNFNCTTSYESQEQYGTGSSRLTAGNVRVPTKSSFIGAPPFAIGIYLEAGVRWNRFTASVDASANDGVSYRDPLTVGYAFRNPNNLSEETSRYQGYYYASPLLAYRVVLAFRLGHRAD